MHTRHRQRGAASLVVALVLLFGVTLVAFFANRTMIFEQRSSANQYRATKAFELADAGLEWAIARLNDPLTLTAGSCIAGSGSGLVSFRGRYARPSDADATHPTGWFNPVTDAYPGCQIPAAGVPQSTDCGCPAAGAAALTAADLPRFRVRFNLASDPSSLEIISRGCTSADPCDPTQAISSATDSTAIARVIVKIVPTFPGGGPKAGLISGSTTVISGSLNVVNTDTRTNGITINSGSTVDLATNGVSVVTLPGTPPSASILDNDPSLLQLTNADANGELFFMSFLGTGFADYRSSPLTKVINGIGGTAFSASTSPNTCNGGNNCARAVSHWIDQGYTQFWVNLNATGADSTIDFTNGTLPATTPNNTIGTESRPIVLATHGQLSTAGGVTAYGVFYAASATAVDDLTLSGGGNSTIYGSLITRGDFARTGNGNITIIPKSKLFGDPGPPGGLLLPVPGSWRDKATPY